LKVLMDSALRIMSGRLFQAVGPANAKARLPNSSRVRGTMRCMPLDAERSDDLGSRVGVVCLVFGRRLALVGHRIHT